VSKFYELQKRHFFDTCLAQLPEELRQLNDVKGDASLSMITRPDLDTYIFCRVRGRLVDNHGVVTREDIGEYSFGSDKSWRTISLHKNDMWLVPYQAVRDLLLQDEVELC
jgi:hypothetical protein